MAVRVQLSSIQLMFLLLCSALLATTLQGVQGEVDVEGPSESECRPYIEKALKKLETGDTQSAEVQEDITHIVTTDDSETQGESLEATDAETSKSVEEGIQGDEGKSAEEAEGATSVEDETTKEEQDTSAETQGDTQEVSGEEKDETVEETGDSGATDDKETEEAADESAEKAQSTEQADEVSAEKEGDTQEVQSEEQQEAEGADASAEDTTAEQEVSKEAEGQEESAEKEGDQDTSVEQEASQEQADQPAEESVEQQPEESAEQQAEDSAEQKEESGEQKVESAEQQAESAEQQAESAEQQAESAEQQAESAEQQAESVEQQAESAEQKDESAEQAESAEQKDESAEQQDESAEQQGESAEQHDESTEQQGESAEQETESAEQKDESVEQQAESVEQQAESAEQRDESGEPKEESTEQKDESTEQKNEATEEAASVEEKEASAEQEGASQEKDGSAEVEEEKETEEVKSEEKTESGEEKDDGEVSEEKKGTKEEGFAEQEQGDEAKESEGEVSEETEEAEPTPEEDLTFEFEIPTELRPRDHINEILHLDDEGSAADNLILKTADDTLKELKRIYENAIKPLETLYKYRDLSNRHFGDPEIFSKPLVLFMGPWSGGKSSIINYLLDNEYTQTSLRTGAEPSPAYFNLLMWGEKPEILDGTQLAADWTFSGLQKFGQGLEERLRGLKLPNKLLEKINIAEIPGILEVRKQVSRVFPFNDACQWFIDRADIIFLVYDPAKLDVGPETEAILDQLKGREYQSRIILNKADQVKPEELMRVQGALIWNISPLMSSAQPPVMYSTSLWSKPYEIGAPTRLLHAQEVAFLKDLQSAIDKRIENKIASARRFAVRVRNHAKMVDCYLTTYYNHKSVFGNKKLIADQIIEHPQDYHIYEGLSTLTNISRYDLPDPDVYRDFFRLNPLYDFQQLSATCTYFRGCPINRLDIAIAYDLPELVGKYKKTVEGILAKSNTESSTKS